MSESVGAKLRQARELRRLTLQQVAEATRVRPHYLQALENDDHSAIPSAAQARGFLRIYASFLEINLADIMPVAPAPQPAAAVEKVLPPPETSQPDSILTRLRARFARRTDHDEVPAQSVEVPAPLPAQSTEPELIGFPSLDTTTKPKTVKKKEKRKRVAPAEEHSPAAPLAIPQEQPSPPSIQSRDVQLPPSGDAYSLEGIPPLEENQTGPVSQPSPETIETGLPVWRAWLTALKRRVRRPRSVHPDDVAPQDAGEAGDAADLPASEPEVEITSNARDFNPLPPESVEAAISSDQIFEEIGRRLRKRREMLSLTYEEIERHTRVRAAFLQALERGALDELPSPVQTRGILANYAAFLDLDADTILLRFADGLQARYHEKGPQKPSRTRAPMTVNTNLPPLRSFIASDLLFGGGIAIMLLLFAIWGIGRVMTVRSVTSAGPTSPSISDVLAGTALPAQAQQVTLIPAQDTSLAPASEETATLQLETLDPNVNVQVNLAAAVSTYMRVTVDGKVQFEGRAVSGTNYSYKAAQQIEILVGNGAALRVTYNTHDLGLMGNFGEIVDRVYTEQGVVTPTSTPRPTQTPTPNLTAIPSETSMPTPSRTPTKKPGG